MKRFIIPIALVLIATYSCDRKDKADEGEVIHVTDGDTFDCILGGKEVTIRLYGVDAPESGQLYGDDAEQWLRDQIGDKSVNIERIEEGYYGRTIAIVKINGKNINGALVKNGLAWVSDRYCDQEELCDRWRDYQQKAQENDAGLWSQPNPTPPWEFRN